MEIVCHLILHCSQQTTRKLTSASVDFESFSKILNRPGGFRDPGEPEEYCRGFQVFDKDMTGFIGVGQLRYSMFPVERPSCHGRQADLRY